MGWGTAGAGVTRAFFRLLDAEKLKFFRVVFFVIRLL